MSGSMNMTDSEVLLAAVEVIRQRGLHKGAYALDGSAACPVCGLGAVSIVIHGQPDPDIVKLGPEEKQFNRVRKALDNAGMKRGAIGWADWQDKTDRTWEDIEAEMIRIAGTL